MSDLGLHYFPMSLKKDARLIWVKQVLQVWKSLLCILSCYSIPAGTSPEMKDLLMKLLKRNAKDRIDFGKITYIGRGLTLVMLNYILMYYNPTQFLPCPVVSMYFQPEWRALFVLIRWLCQKSADLDLHCFQKG